MRHWHPNQAWIWAPGGFGVFDPGINALSILTEILPGPFTVGSARLVTPENVQTPIAAEVAMTGRAGLPGQPRARLAADRARRPGTSPSRPTGALALQHGGATLVIDGEEQVREPEREYPLIYRRFAELLAARESEVDTSPLRIIADAFLIGRRETTEAFHD